jgi:dsRNA-specific ribonuclease
MSTTMEAILGAVHLDGDEIALAQVMERLGLTHKLLKVVRHYFIIK